MALYNVSINLKGLRYISESPGFIPLLWWLLSGKEGSPHSSPAADGGSDGSNLGAFTFRMQIVCPQTLPFLKISNDF